MLDIIIDSISFEFGLNAWQNTVANPFVQGAIMKNNANVMSTLEKMTKSVNKTIQKLSEKGGKKSEKCTNKRYNKE